MKIKTNRLEGAALDWAVAMAVEAWKDAHQWFPTMTLDPSFSGVQPMVYSDGQAFCQLIPNNPFRQDYQIYRPSTDWSQCGPLIEQYGIKVGPQYWPFDSAGSQWFAASSNDVKSFSLIGPTPLVVACRAVVMVEIGDEVEVPAAFGEES